jgi:F-type H+-transporting ATPase subunit beta
MTIDTGIKALDLFAPLPSAGVVSLAAPAGHGALVLLLEVLHRTDARLVALGAQTRTRDPREFAAMFHEVLTPERRETALLDAVEPADARLAHLEDRLAHARALHAETGDLVFLVVDVAGLAGVAPRALDTGPGVLVVLFEALLTGDDPDAWHEVADSAWRFSTEMARAGAYPALDPARSHTVGAPAHEDARARWAAGGAWATRLEMYLSQPFEVAEYFTGIPGNHVPAATARADLSALLAGAADHLDPEALRFKGALDEVA